ncbi:uncharacterized protein C1orf131 homolog [Prionailurus iriomotensis]
MAQERGSEAPAPPGSQTLLDALLRNLYDFGETEDEAEQKRIRKKGENKRRDVGTPVTLAADPAPVPGSPVRGRRKRVSSFFKELREELQGVPAVTPTSSPLGPDAPSATASPSTLRNSRERVQVIEFHSRNKKRKGKPDQDENTQSVRGICDISSIAGSLMFLKEIVNLREFSRYLIGWLGQKKKEKELRQYLEMETKTNILGNDVDRQEFNLEKARLEVHRFGITGYGKGKERVLERERAIMLGAQPPKNSYVNYKVLQEQIKEKKAAKEEEKRMEDRRAKKKKSAPSILSSGQIGQVGKFKNGTLILSQVDIKKINSSRVAK